MTIEEKRVEFDDFADKIIMGVRKANYKLVIEAAVKDESLVIGDEKGNSKLVPAKELLEKLIKDDSDEFRSVLDQTPLYLLKILHCIDINIPQRK
jgi:hypothetical protein